MIFPPSIIYFTMGQPPRTRGVYLPLVVLWLPLALLWVLVLALMLVAAAARWRRDSSKAVLLAWLWLLVVFCGLRGLELDVETEGTNRRIRIW